MNLGKKIAIIGLSGAGKSTLARKLNEKISLPLYHMDQFTWKNGWEKQASNDEILHYIESILVQPEWLLEGYLGYNNLPDTRLQAADTVLVLDYPRWLLGWRYLKRHFLYHNKHRPEFPSICKESFGWKAIRSAVKYLTAPDWRTNLENWMAHVEPEKRMVFKTPRQLQNWLMKMGL